MALPHSLLIPFANLRNFTFSRGFQEQDQLLAVYMKDYISGVLLMSSAGRKLY